MFWSAGHHLFVPSKTLTHYCLINWCNIIYNFMAKVWWGSGTKTSWLLLGNDLSLDQNKNFPNVREHYQLETEHEQQTSVSKANVFLTHPPNLFYRHITSTFFMLLSELLRLLYGFIAWMWIDCTCWNGWCCRFPGFFQMAILVPLDQSLSRTLTK